MFLSHHLIFFMVFFRKMRMTFCLGAMHIDIYLKLIW